MLAFKVCALTKGMLSVSRERSALAIARESERTALFREWNALARRQREVSAEIRRLDRHEGFDNEETAAEAALTRDELAIVLRKLVYAINDATSIEALREQLGQQLLAELSGDAPEALSVEAEERAEQSQPLAHRASITMPRTITAANAAQYPPPSLKRFPEEKRVPGACFEAQTRRSVRVRKI